MTPASRAPPPRQPTPFAHAHSTPHAHSSPPPRWQTLLDRLATVNPLSPLPATFPGVAHGASGLGVARGPRIGIGCDPRSNCFGAADEKNARGRTLASSSSHLTPHPAELLRAQTRSPSAKLTPVQTAIALLKRTEGEKATRRLSRTATATKSKEEEKKRRRDHKPTTKHHKAHHHHHHDKDKKKHHRHRKHHHHHHHHHHHGHDTRARAAAAAAAARERSPTPSPTPTPTPTRPPPLGGGESDLRTKRDAATERAIRMERELSDGSDGGGSGADGDTRAAGRTVPPRLSWDDAGIQNERSVLSRSFGNLCGLLDDAYGSFLERPSPTARAA